MHGRSDCNRHIHHIDGFRFKQQRDIQQNRISAKTTLDLNEFVLILTYEWVENTLELLALFFMFKNKFAKLVAF